MCSRVLAVEVRSPGTPGATTSAAKRDLYERNGVAEVWLADTASRTLLPGFGVAVGELIPAVS